jgi:hypothetical protein
MASLLAQQTQNSINIFLQTPLRNLESKDATQAQTDDGKKHLSSLKIQDNKVDDKDKTRKSTDSVVDPKLHPTHAFFIPRHYGHTKKIPIWDVTSHVNLSTYPLTEGKEIDPWFQAANTKGLERTAANDAPNFAIHRQNWYGNNFTLHTGLEGDSETVLTWKGAWHSRGKNHFSFPEDAIHCSHEVTMKADNYIKFREEFVVDSCKYEWHCLNRLKMRQFRCDRVLSGDIQTVARMWQRGWDWFAQGGVVVVDANEVDEVVILATALVILRKTRQKSYEYSNMGA